MNLKDDYSLLEQWKYKVETTMDVPEADTPISQVIKERLQNSDTRFFANDNIADFIEQGEIESLIDEVAQKFQGVLDSLIIDQNNDPNSKDTGRRMAKMYINEIMRGRYFPEPDVTAFPNDDDQTKYEGILITKNPIKSLCSHHHQVVSGTCWIGIIPSTKVIGLSKYGRLVDHLSRRGTLQEELARQILETVKLHTSSNDVGVVIIAKHGCCENRGLMNPDSSTITSMMSGQFFSASVRDEFMSMIANHKGLY